MLEIGNLIPTIIQTLSVFYLINITHDFLNSKDINSARAIPVIFYIFIKKGPLKTQ